MAETFSYKAEFQTALEQFKKGDEIVYKTVLKLKCPKCSKFHVVDKLYERMGLAIDCETYNVKVDIPGCISLDLINKQLQELFADKPYIQYSDDKTIQLPIITIRF